MVFGKLKKATSSKSGDGDDGYLEDYGGKDEEYGESYGDGGGDGGGESSKSLGRKQSSTVSAKNPEDVPEAEDHSGHGDGGEEGKTFDGDGDGDGDVEEGGGKGEGGKGGLFGSVFGGGKKDKENTQRTADTQIPAFDDEDDDNFGAEDDNGAGGNIDRLDSEKGVGAMRRLLDRDRLKSLAAPADADATAQVLKENRLGRAYSCVFLLTIVISGAISGVHRQKGWETWGNMPPPLEVPPPQEEAMMADEGTGGPPTLSPTVSLAPTLSAQPSARPSVSAAPSLSFAPSSSPSVSGAPSVSARPTDEPTAAPVPKVTDATPGDVATFGGNSTNGTDSRPPGEPPLDGSLPADPFDDGNGDGERLPEDLVPFDPFPDANATFAPTISPAPSASARPSASPTYSRAPTLSPTLTLAPTLTTAPTIAPSTSSRPSLTPSSSPSASSKPSLSSNPSSVPTVTSSPTASSVPSNPPSMSSMPTGMPQTEDERIEEAEEQLREDNATNAEAAGDEGIAGDSAGGGLWQDTGDGKGEPLAEDLPPDFEGMFGEEGEEGKEEDGSREDSPPIILDGGDGEETDRDDTDTDTEAPTFDFLDGDEQQKDDFINDILEDEPPPPILDPDELTPAKEPTPPPVALTPEQIEEMREPPDLGFDFFDDEEEKEEAVGAADGGTNGEELWSDGQEGQDIEEEEEGRKRKHKEAGEVELDA